MKRPSRKVVLVEDYEEPKVDSYGQKYNVQLWRVHLECGHYVNLSKRKRHSPPDRWLCTICASKGGSDA